MSRTGDEKLQPIWGQLAKAIGVRELPKVVKEELLERFEQDIDAVIGTGELDGYLVEFAKSFYKIHMAPKSRREGNTTSGSGGREIVPKVGNYENLRAAVVSEYLAKVAALDPQVVRFRNDVLNSELLTPEQAHTFFSSPATRFLSCDVWRTFGIPAKHTAALLDENFGRTEDGPFHWVQVQTNPPGETHAVFIPNPQSYDTLIYRAEDGQPKGATFWPGSVLGGLRKLSKELTKSHPWNIDEATWFVLTGEHPIVGPIKAKINSSWTVGTRAHATISLTVQPWVPPETVEIVYRQLQKQAIGGNYGRISDKNLNLLRFVTERADSAGNLPKGEVLVKDWDKKWKHQRPEWCYGADTRRFWRDFRNVQRNLTNSKRAGLFVEAGVYPREEYVSQV